MTQLIPSTGQTTVKQKKLIAEIYSLKTTELWAPEKTDKLIFFNCGVIVTIQILIMMQIKSHFHI